MNKRNIILFVFFILGILILGNILALSKDKKTDDTLILNENLVIYNDDKDISKNKKIEEIVENTTIQGMVELKNNGYIYIFNGQHFGEYGFEMDEYTSANIDNKNQECIDYSTSEKYDTSYIKEGDIIICTGELKKYSMEYNELDTKDNPIIVLKEKDYNKIKENTINNDRTEVITVGEYFDMSNELYIKYDISEGKYKLPFVLKFNIEKDTQIIGNLAKGKKIKIQYKDLNASLDKLKLKKIKVIE